MSYETAIFESFYAIKSVSGSVVKDTSVTQYINQHIYK